MLKFLLGILFPHQCLRGLVPNYYHLSLEENHVGNLKISLHISQVGNIIIDSGSHLTYLPSYVPENFISMLSGAIDLPLVNDSYEESKLFYFSDVGDQDENG